MEGKAEIIKKDSKMTCKVFSLVIFILILMILTFSRSVTAQWLPYSDDSSVAGISGRYLSPFLFNTLDFPSVMNPLYFIDLNYSSSFNGLAVNSLPSLGNSWPYPFLQGTWPSGWIDMGANGTYYPPLGRIGFGTFPSSGFAFSPPSLYPLFSIYPATMLVDPILALSFAWRPITLATNLSHPIWSYPVNTNIYPVPPSPEPPRIAAPAPTRMKGEWKSDTSTNEDGSSMKGELRISKMDTCSFVVMTNSPLLIDEGPITQFKYTPTIGEAPLLFEANLDTGYIAQFSGIADNALCPLDLFCFWAGIFSMEGDYTIKDSLGQIADYGTFTLSGPDSASPPAPEPDSSIKILYRKPYETRCILSMTTGMDGKTYVGMRKGCQSEGSLLERNAQYGWKSELGQPGYECTAMTTGKDGLIYLGGGARYQDGNNLTAAGYGHLAVYDPNRSWDPVSGQSANPRDIGQIISSPQEPWGKTLMITDLITSQDGLIYGCTGYKYATLHDQYVTLFAYNPQTGLIENLGQPLPSQSGLYSLAQSSLGIIYGVVRPPSDDKDHPSGGKIFSYNPQSSSFTTIDPMALVNEDAEALTIGTDGLIYFAGSGSRIYTFNPVTGSTELKGDLGGAKVLRMVSNNQGIIYMGCGKPGYFVRYNPQEPWQENPWEESHDVTGYNPRMFHGTGEVNTLTIGLEGYYGLVYFGTLSGVLMMYTGSDLPKENIPGGSMHIASIVMSLLPDYNQIKGALASVKIVDEAGNPVQGVTVTGHWSGLSSGNNFDACTDSEGFADIGSPRVPTSLEGDFCFTIDQITKTNWTYCPEADLKKNSCIHTPF